MEKKGKGYKKDQSMSINASLAYLNGEMPKSKWNKKAVIEFLENEDRPDLVEKAQPLPYYVLAQYLKCTSWHHTSKFYNQTDFWIFGINLFEMAEQADFEKLIADYRAKNPTKTKEERELASQKAAMKRGQKAEELAWKNTRQRINRLSKISGMPSKASLLKSIKSGKTTLADVETLAREALKNEIKPYQKQNAEMRAKMGFAPTSYDDNETLQTLKKIYNL